MTKKKSEYDRLVEQARRLGRHKTKQEAIRAALHAYIRRREQTKIIERSGTFDFDPDSEYKAASRRK